VLVALFVSRALRCKSRSQAGDTVDYVIASLGQGFTSFCRDAAAQAANLCMIVVRNRFSVIARTILPGPVGSSALLGATARLHGSKPSQHQQLGQGI
jgi:hypothetical protein